MCLYIEFGAFWFGARKSIRRLLYFVFKFHILLSWNHVGRCFNNVLLGWQLGNALMMLLDEFLFVFARVNAVSAPIANALTVTNAKPGQTSLCLTRLARIRAMRDHHVVLYALWNDHHKQFRRNFGNDGAMKRKTKIPDTSSKESSHGSLVQNNAQVDSMRSCKTHL